MFVASFAGHLLRTFYARSGTFVVAMAGRLRRRSEELGHVTISLKLGAVSSRQTASFGESDQAKVAVMG